MLNELPHWTLINILMGFLLSIVASAAPMNIVFLLADDLG